MFFLVLAAVLMIGGLLGYGWLLNQQVTNEVLLQQREAAQRPDWVSLQRLPTYVPAAFLLVVGPEFPGRSTPTTDSWRAALAGELVRELYRPEADIPGRAREAGMPPLLERRLSEQALLELYLNRVYLGEEQGWPVYGIFHAAQEYFGKPPGALTLAETATLAGLLLPPRIRNPEAQIGAVGVRRNEVLRQMLDAGSIGAAQYRVAIAEPLGFQPGIDEAPMTRALGAKQPRVIRVPADLPSETPDSVPSD